MKRALSLRGRLILATVTLVTFGLLAADFATFALLRNSLTQRVDEQLRRSRLAGARIFQDEGRFPVFVGPGPGSPPEGAGPSVIVAELLDPAGQVVRTQSFGFSEVTALPDLPPGLPGSSSARGGVHERILSVGATGGSSLRYRVIAVSLGDASGTFAIAQSLSDVDATLRKLVLVEAIATATVLAGVAALALWLVRLGLRPLTEMEKTAEHIAGGDLSRRVDPSDDRTEVGRLGRALNAMLERIEAAFAERGASEARLRRFVADASHELRTPLTSIRGYAELFRHGAVERPDDLEKSMRRIEEESVRMGTLVDELLLLARLDQGPVLERAPVDLNRVAADAVEDARAVQPDRPISYDTDFTVTVEGDEARLRQVAANLLANTLRHTPRGTPVHVSVTADDGRALLEVADEGPGLDQEEAAHVFDRFYRVDQARTHKDGGTGLGLSIVAAIARAHGGGVSVVTTRGGGARFVVTLPRLISEDA
jgi:two-component system OmpR family sensor kinase